MSDFDFKNVFDSNEPITDDDLNRPDVLTLPVGMEYHPAVISLEDQLSNAKRDFKKYESSILSMEADATDMEITDERSNTIAVEMTLQGKKLFKLIDDLRMYKTKKTREYNSSINTFAKIYTSKVKRVVDILDRKVTGYSDKQEIILREKERKLQDEAKKIQDRIDEEAKEKNIEAVQIVKQVLPKKIEPTRTEAGTAIVRKVWTWDKENYDFEKIPDKYKMIDEKAVNQAIRAAIQMIPGIRIYQKKSTQYRSA